MHLLVAGDVSDYSDTSSLRADIARIAGVATAYVHIVVQAPGSATLVVTILTQASTTSITATAVHDRVHASLGTSQSASAALGLIVVDDPIILTPGARMPTSASGNATTDDVSAADATTASLSDAQGERGRLSAGTIAGIILGSVALLVLGGVLVHSCRRRRGGNGGASKEHSATTPLNQPNAYASPRAPVEASASHDPTFHPPGTLSAAEAAVSYVRNVPETLASDCSSCRKMADGDAPSAPASRSANAMPRAIVSRRLSGFNRPRRRAPAASVGANGRAASVANEDLDDDGFVRSGFASTVGYGIRARASSKATPLDLVGIEEASMDQLDTDAGWAAEVEREIHELRQKRMSHSENSAACSTAGESALVRARSYKL